MTITTRERVRAAVDQALADDSSRDLLAATYVAAAELALPVEAVLDAMTPAEEAPAC